VNNYTVFYSYLYFYQLLNIRYCYLIKIALQNFEFLKNVLKENPNHLGSTALITSAGQKDPATVEWIAGEEPKVVSEVYYEPYGGIVRQEVDGTAISNGADIFRYKYTGQEDARAAKAKAEEARVRRLSRTESLCDYETSLMYYGARYYDPDIGRFITADTIVPTGGMNSQGLNRYMYVAGNPVKYTDPTGRAWYNDWDDFKSAVTSKKAIATVGMIAGIVSLVVGYGMIPANPIAGWGLVALGSTMISTSATYMDDDPSNDGFVFRLFWPIDTGGKDSDPDSNGGYGPNGGGDSSGGSDENSKDDIGFKPIMPVDGTRTGDYDETRTKSDGTTYPHSGWDEAAPKDTPIYAAESGRIDKIIPNFHHTTGYGARIDIDHGGGLTTRYAHLSAIHVSPKQYVYKGQLIGRVGNSGGVSGKYGGYHLHFEIRTNGNHVNPAIYYYPWLFGFNY